MSIIILNKLLDWHYNYVLLFNLNSVIVVKAAIISFLIHDLSIASWSPCQWPNSWVNRSQFTCWESSIALEANHPCQEWYSSNIPLQPCSPLPPTLLTPWALPIPSQTLSIPSQTLSTTPPTIFKLYKHYLTKLKWNTRGRDFLVNLVMFI